MNRITDTYDAACLAIVRQAMGQLEPAISTDEAAHRVRRARMLVQIARFGVPVAVLESADLDKWAKRLGLKL